MGGDAEKRGASFEHTILWMFVGRDSYEKPLFLTVTKLMIPLVNVYYFFIRRGLLWGCVTNVFKTFSSKFGILNSPPLTLKDRRLLVELFVVCYMSGISWVPGGHIQFIIWFVDFVPLILGMTGLPELLFFKIYSDVFPVHLDSRNIHHAILLIVTLWLLTVGPKN